MEQWCDSCIAGFSLESPGQKKPALQETTAAQDILNKIWIFFSEVKVESPGVRLAGFWVKGVGLQVKTWAPWAF